MPRTFQNNKTNIIKGAPSFNKYYVSIIESLKKRKLMFIELCSTHLLFTHMRFQTLILA
jgi:hypothetical protein